VNVSPRISRAWPRTALFIALACAALPIARAQETAADSAGRWKLYGINVARVSVGALGFAAWDQWRNDPEEWGKGWPGYQRRAVSEIAGSFVQETITEGLAAALHRPRDYTRCVCQGGARRFEWAVSGALVDHMANGSRPIAVPRIVGAYSAAYIRTTWHPAKEHDRPLRTLISGSSSLGIGALINLAYEFVIKPRRG